MAVSSSRRTKFILDEDRIPRAWYNIAADLPVPPAARRSIPGTGQPIGPGDLAPLFPMELIKQVVSTRPRDRDPRAGPRGLRALPAVARSTAPTGSRRRSIRRRTSTTSTRAAARRAATSRTPRSPRPSTTRQEGVTRLATETGAGQWGSALAFAGAVFGLEVKVYMVRASYDQKPYRRILMETYGAQVVRQPVSLDTQYGRKVLAETPGPHRLAGHRDQRGDRGHRHPSRDEVLARARSSTSCCSTRRSSARRRSSRWRWPARSRT